MVAHIGAQAAVVLLAAYLLSGCAGTRGGAPPAAEDTLESQPVDPRDTSLVILETEVPGRGCWGILPKGWQVLASETAGGGTTYPLPAELTSPSYPDAVVKVEALPEPGSEARVLADASGDEGVSLSVFFGGIEQGEAQGVRYVAFETFVGSELWRLRFTIRSKAMNHAELQKALYEFVEAVRPGTPARGLVD
ncbi:MAG: hypothetical protein AB1725_12175 [Armatimonadota bacterium]